MKSESPTAHSVSRISVAPVNPSVTHSTRAISLPTIPPATEGSDALIQCMRSASRPLEASSSTAKPITAMMKERRSLSEVPSRRRYPQTTAYANRPIHHQADTPNRKSSTSAIQAPTRPPALLISTPAAL